jgi:hypothetical protein
MVAVLELVVWQLRPERLVQGDCYVQSGDGYGQSYRQSCEEWRFFNSS